MTGQLLPVQRELSAVFQAALERAVARGALGLDPAAIVAPQVERPRLAEHGDWATNVALQLAKQAGRPPREVASLLAARLGEVPGIKSVDVAGPGFLNVVLDAAAAGELAGAGRPGERGVEQLGQIALDGEDGGGHDTPGVAAPRSCWAMIPATRCRSWIGSNGLVT